MPQQRCQTPQKGRSPHRASRVPRALVLPNDPAWLHEGITMRLLYRGHRTDFFAVSAMAEALGKSVGTVRRLESQGLLPTTEFRSPGRGVVGQKRLYTRAQVFAAARASLDAGLYRRRPRRWTEPLLTTFEA